MDDKNYATDCIYDANKAKEMRKNLFASLDNTTIELVKEGATKAEQIKILQELTGWSLLTVSDILEDILRVST